MVHILWLEVIESSLIIFINISHMKQFIFLFFCLISIEYVWGQAVTKNGKIVSTEASYINSHGAMGITGVNKNGQSQLTLNSIGQIYQGGVIFYILQNGDLGYDGLTIHGLIVSTIDQSAGISWYNDIYLNAGTSTTLGSGLSNTNSINSKISALGSNPLNYAAGVARAYAGGGYTDWYLPSVIEMAKIFQNVGQIAAAPRTNIVNLSGNQYWTSSENRTGIEHPRFVYAINYGQVNSPFDSSGNGWNGGSVRAIRAF